MRIPLSRRMSSLLYLARPLALTFIGILFLSLGATYLSIWFYRSIPLPEIFETVTLQFLPHFQRGLLFVLVGLAVLATGMWQLSTMVIIPLHDQRAADGELVLGYQRTQGRPRIAVLSGGAGMLILSGLGEHVERLTCITPVQDAVEYYYRASGLFNFQNVYYVVPTPVAARVYAELDNGMVMNVMRVDHDPTLAGRHVARLMLIPDGMDEDAATRPSNGDQRDGTDQHLMPMPVSNTKKLPLTRLARETLRDADALLLGPGSLFESILPNLLIDELREAVQQSTAIKIYICNLMTEPGLTTGFSVGDHIRQIKRYGGFVPDYVLVNVQRIDTEVAQLYAAANQAPVYLDPDAYEETTILTGQDSSQRHVIVEGSVVIEADLASSVVQYTASLGRPGESRAVRVLRHDPQKLTATILKLLGQV